MDKKLFVSYARKDYKLVEEFIEASSLGSFDLWIDQHSQDYGDKWKDSIHKAIDSCNGAIIFVSQNSLKSEIITQLELPEIIKKKDSDKSYFLYIVIIDRVPQNILDNYVVSDGQKIFQERHIINSSANKDVNKDLPSEMMVGARGKYWTQLVSTIQSDFSKNKQTTQISKKKIRGVRQISLFLVIALVGYTIYASVNSLANSLDNRVASAVSNIIDSIQSSSSIDNESNIPADTSTSTSTTIADSTTTTVPIVTTTTVTSTTTTVPINTTIASSTASSRSNVYELNLLTQNVDFQRDIFENWVSNASIYKIIQWKEGVEFEFTPLYDLNAYKIYVNGTNVGTQLLNQNNSYYVYENKVVLTGLRNTGRYEIEIYVIDRYYREFGPISTTFRFEYNNDDDFPHFSIPYTTFGDLNVAENRKNNFNSPEITSPTELSDVEVTTYKLNDSTVRLAISNLSYKNFTHFIVVVDDEMIFLSNVLDTVQITKNMVGRYLLVYPMNNVLVFGNPYELLISEDFFK